MGYLYSIFVCIAYIYLDVFGCLFVLLSMDYYHCQPLPGELRSAANSDCDTGLVKVDKLDIDQIKHKVSIDLSLIRLQNHST